MKKVGNDIGSYEFDAYHDKDTEFEILKRQASLALTMETQFWKNAGLKRDMDVLDMGCGCGFTSVFLAEYVKDGKVLGVDPSEELISSAKLQAKDVPNVQFELGNVYDFSISERKFDFIYCRFLFQHLREPEKALRNLKKTLKPGGIICIMDVDDSWLMLYPEPEVFSSLVERAAKSQAADGGDRFIGKKIPFYLNAAGFSGINAEIKAINSFELGLDLFLSVALGFRAERLPDSEAALAKKELEEIYSNMKGAPMAWGSMGIFVVNGKKT
jgi:ubiquinone/menaquinone biosynthesis C-methylase UbiE